MAIAQMESVANDPNQLKMAAEQMKNMSESDLRRAMNMAGGPTAAASSSTSSSSSSSVTSSSSAPSSKNNNININDKISKTQCERAARQMSTMSPSQLRQQASVLRSMPYDTLRRTNPPMAHMTDAQIEMSIQQLEQMADNPDMIKMAADSMKGMTEEQYESMKTMLGGGGGGGFGGVGGNGTGNETMPSDDPSKMMMEGLLSNPDQLNSMVRTMKQNPELLKQVMASQCGPAMMLSEKQKEQMTKAVDSFAEMDDGTLDRYLRLANGLQRMAKPAVATFEKAKKRLGLSTKAMVLLIIFVVLAFFGLLLARLYWWWWKPRSGGDDDVTNGMVEEEGMASPAGYDGADAEF